MKKVVAESAHCDALRSLKNNENSTGSCNDFLLCYSRPKFAPLLSRTGYQYSHYVQWLVNSVRLPEKFVLRRATECPLCEGPFSPEEDGRAHLLTECKSTDSLRDEFQEALLSIDQTKAAELASLDKHERWIWIVAAGCIPAPPPQRMYVGKRKPRCSAFREGECYEPSKRHDDVLSFVASFESYQNIRARIPRSAYHVFTDGSRNTNSLHSGAAAVVRQHNAPVAICQQYTGTQTVNYAELHAVLLGLRWIADNPWIKKQQFHFWIDSKYAFRLLTEKDVANKHFFLVQDIFQLASSLEGAFKHTFTIHRITSHVEVYSAGACRIEGSIQADHLANEASKQIAPFQSVEEVRSQILDQSAQLLQKIDGLLNPPKPDGPSRSASVDSDDLAYQLLPNRASHGSSVLHPNKVSQM